jgi:branched-chain amino acid transport system substrate-binding protein
MGIKQPVFGYDRMSHPLLLKYAGSAAEGLVAISSYNPTSADSIWQTFRARYRQRFGSEPDTFAAHGYDAATLIVRAIRSAGLNRYRIRDALFANRKVRGVTGDIVFDTNMCDVGLPWLAEVRNGRFRYFRGGWWESAPLAAFTASFR